MMENNKKIEALKKEFMALYEPHIEEGIEIILDSYASDGGYMRKDSFYHIKDGKKSTEGMDIIKELLKTESKKAFRERREDGVKQLIKMYPSYRKIRFHIVKGQDLVVEVVNPKELIKDIKRTLLEWVELKNLEKVIDEVEYTECDYNKNKTTCIINEQFICQNETKTSKISQAITDYEYLYYTLDGQINELRVEVTKDDIIVQADKAFPEWGIELIQKEAVAGIDGSDIKTVYEYIESGDEQKIRKAIEVVKGNNELQSSIEKRYLNLVRARLNNPDATIEGLSKDLLTEIERRTLLGRNVSKTFISYSYMDDDQTKMVVDFIGAMVKNHLDIGQFIAQAKKTTNEDELKGLFDTYSSRLRKDIDKEVEKYSEGWYGEISSKLLNMELEKVMFEKTDFYEANKSLVLREYMFFLGMVAEDRLYMDIYQSDPLELTEVFWMLKEIPKTNWSDVEPKFPELHLSYKRDGIMRIGDYGLWVYILDGYPTFEYHSEEILLCDDEDYEKAVECYTKVLEKREDGRGYYGRGLTYIGWSWDNYKLAADDFDKAASLGVDVADGYYDIGKHLYYKHDFKDAAICFTKSIDSRGKGDSYYYRGLCNHYLGDNQKAIEDFDRALEIGGEDVDYLYSKAYILSALQEYDESMSLFKRVIELKPSTFNYKNRALIYKKMGEYEKAIEDYTSAIECSDDKSEISMLLVLRAGIYKLLDDFDNVWKDLHVAIEKDPDNAAVYLDTIELYITTNNCSKGLEYIEKHEGKILESCNERQKLIFLYLKATIFIALDMSIDSFKEDIYTLGSKGMELNWYFGHTNQWLVESDLSQDKKQEITHLTDVIEDRK